MGLQTEGILCTKKREATACTTGCSRSISRKTRDDDRRNKFELVGDFMQAFGQSVEEQPTWPDFNTRELRVDLIQEEVDELVEAIANKDMVEIADALTDILYVVYGAGHTFGIDLDECFTEVHASNMSKLVKMERH